MHQKMAFNECPQVASFDLKPRCRRRSDHVDAIPTRRGPRLIAMMNDTVIAPMASAVSPLICWKQSAIEEVRSTVILRSVSAITCFNKSHQIRSNKILISAQLHHMKVKEDHNKNDLQCMLNTYSDLIGFLSHWNW